jgi:DNA-binding transcriptional LysR family regulator
VAGLGIIGSFQELLEPGLGSGLLVAILDDWVSEFSGPYLYYASRRHMPAPLRAFVDFLKLERPRAPSG